MAAPRGGAFFSSTAERRASSRASATCSGEVAMACTLRAGSAGVSSSPSAAAAVSTRVARPSITEMGTVPFAMNWGRYWYW